MIQKFVVVCCCLLYVGTADGFQNERWQGSSEFVSEASFFDGNNWQGGVVPTENARFGSDANPTPDGTHAIYFGDFLSDTNDFTPGGNAELVDLFVEGGDYVFDFGVFNSDGSTTGAIQVSNDFVIGLDDPGTGALQTANFTVRGPGSINAEDLLVADPFGGNNSVGRLTISGNETDLIVQDFFQVGIDGSQAIIEQGASAQASIFSVASDSQSFIRNNGTSFTINTDAESNGIQVITGARLNISDSAQTFSGGLTLIAARESEESVLEVEGGSLTTSSTIFLAPQSTVEGGTSSLIVSNGGVIQSSAPATGFLQGVTAIVGDANSSIGMASITGNGSMWIQDGAALVGFRGPGVLEILDGGYLESSEGLIATNPAAVGFVNVAQGGHWTIHQDIYVGGNQVSNGGNANVSVGANGLIEIGNLLKVYSDGVFDVEQMGQVQIGDTVSNKRDGFVSIGQGGILNGDGIVSANVFNDDGELLPGCPIGSLAIGGDLELGAGSKLIFELAGCENFDTIQLTGDIDADGLMVLAFAENFAPRTDDSFVLVSGFGTFSNAFQEIRIAGLKDNFEFQTEVTSEGYVLTALNDAVPALLGDVNLDGTTDLLDIAPFVEAIVAGNYVPEADINLDGEVNLFDVAPFIEILTTTKESTIADAREAGVGVMVTINDVTITSLTDLVQNQSLSSFHVEDSTGAVTVFGDSVDLSNELQCLEVGDVVDVSGVTSSFNGLFQINQLDTPPGDFDILDTAMNNLPVLPTVVGTSDFRDDSPTG